MKLERFKLNENHIPEFQKVELIENISKNWNQKLEEEFITPRSLFKFNISELIDIQNKFLYETVEEPPAEDDMEVISVYTGEEEEDEKTTIDDSLETEDPEEFKEVEDLPTRTEEDIILGELREKYLGHEAVEDIRLENDGQPYFVFDVKCETEVQSMNEYAGYRLVFNHLCNIEEHINEDIINERYIMFKEKLIDEYLNEVKKMK